MRGASVREPWGIESVQVVDDLPIPAAPSPHEVLVEMRAASLVWRDLAEAKYAKKPYIPLSDGVGTVVSVGKAVTRCRVGDRVCPIFADWISGEPDPAQYVATALGSPTSDGVLRERMLMSEEQVVVMPAYLSDDEACCLPCSAVTAWRALVTEGHLEPGQTVLVQGTGGVSLFVLQIAVAYGCKVIVTSSSDAKLTRAKQLAGPAWLGGINYRQVPKWGKAAKKMAVDPTGKNHGVHHVVEVCVRGWWRERIGPSTPHLTHCEHSITLAQTAHADGRSAERQPSTNRSNPFGTAGRWRWSVC